MSRISASHANTKARLRTMLISAGVVAALLGLLIYNQARDGSTTRSEATPGARSEAFHPPGLAAPGTPRAPYRFVGTSSQGGETQYLLASEEQVFSVSVGSTLNGVYRVESAGERELALVHLPTGVRQTVALQVAPWPPTGEPATSSGLPAKPSPLPPAVQRTTSPALQELSR